MGQASGPRVHWCGRRGRATEHCPASAHSRLRSCLLQAHASAGRTPVQDRRSALLIVCTLAAAPGYAQQDMQACGAGLPRPAPAQALTLPYPTYATRPYPAHRRPRAVAEHVRNALVHLCVRGRSGRHARSQQRGRPHGPRRQRVRQRAHACASLHAQRCLRSACGARRAWLLRAPGLRALASASRRNAGRLRSGH